MFAAGVAILSFSLTFFFGGGGGGGWEGGGLSFDHDFARFLCCFSFFLYILLTACI